MRAFYVRIKCELGKTHEVAKAIADMELHSEIYSTAGSFDLIVKYFLDESQDIGQFVNEKIHSVGGIRDTETLITFRAF